MNRSAMVWGAAWVLLGVTPALADSIATDRPDFVESSNVVGTGRQQIEVGLSYERESADGITASTFTTPALLRVGLNDKWEARIETDGFTRLHVSDGSASETQTGVADAAIGAKWHFLDAVNGAPSMALLFHADLPTGSEKFRNVGVRPSVRMAAEWEVSDGASIGVMPGVIRDRDDTGQYTAWIMAVTMGVDINANLHGFVEIAGQQFASSEHGGNIITYDAGVSHLLDDDTQLDAVVNVGANNSSPDWSVGVGYSHRFGKNQFLRR